MKQGTIIGRMFSTSRAIHFFASILVFISVLHTTTASYGGETVLVPQLGITEEIVGTPSISPDGRLVATIDRGFQVLIWDVETGRQLRHLEPPSSGMRELAGGLAVAGTRKMQSPRGRALFSPDGKLLAATESGGATIWNVSSGRKLVDIRVDAALEPQDIAFSPDGKRIAIPGLLGDCTVWDAETGKRLTSVAGGFFERVSGKHANPTTVAWNPAGTHLAVAGLRRSTESGKTAPNHWVRIFDSSSGTELATLEHLATPLPSPAGKSMYAPDFHTALAFSPSGDLLAVGGYGRIWLRTTTDWKELPGIEFHDSVGSLRFTADGKTLIASGNGTRALYYIDVAHRIIERRIDQGFDAVILGFDLSADGRQIVSAGRRVIRIGEAGIDAQHWRSSVPSISGIRGSRNGRRLVATNDIATFSIWDMEGGMLSSINTAVLELPASVKFANSALISFSDQGDRLMTWTYIGTKIGEQPAWSDYDKVLGMLAFWDAATGRKLRAIGDISSPIDFTNQRFLAWHKDKTLGLRRMGDGELIHSIPLSERIPRLVKISPTGRWVALAGAESDGKGRISVWDTSAGKVVASTSGVWEVIDMHFDRGGEGKVFFRSGTRGTIYSTAQKIMETPIVEWDFLTGQTREHKSEGGDSGMPPVLLRGFSSSTKSNASCCTRAGGKIEITDNATGVKRELSDSFFRGGDVAGIAFVGDKELLAVGVTDGSIRLLETDNGKTLLTLYGLKGEGGNTDWLAVTPDGLFDGTPGGWDALLWRFSDELYDVAPGEAFFNEFYRPGLLAEIMAGGRPKPPRSLAAVDRRQPKVALQVTGGSERLAKVRIDVREAPPGGGRTSGSGVKDVRLFRNGSLVKYWKGEVGAGGTALETDISIVAGENRFTAYAFNRDNIKSGDARALVTGAETLKRPATAWVLAFGINRYANPAFNLSYSVADAQAFSDQLKTNQTALGLYQKINVVTVKDEEATKANLLAALRRLAGTDSGPLPKGAPKTFADLKPAQPEDAVFIFFAGHGIADGPRFYLLPHDLGYAGGAGSIDATAKAAILRNAVSDLELEAALETLDAGRLVLTIDACNSGQALEAEERRRGPMNSKGLAQLAYEKGMYVITAAQSHQAALEFEQLGHGLLTFALIKEGLAQGQADAQPQDGKVDVREWLDYAARRVPQLQLAAMRESAERGRKVAVVRGEETEADPLKRSLQQPRIFYRREPERTPFVVGGK